MLGCRVRGEMYRCLLPPCTVGLERADLYSSAPRRMRRFRVWDSSHWNLSDTKCEKVFPPGY